MLLEVLSPPPPPLALALALLLTAVGCQTLVLQTVVGAQMGRQQCWPRHCFWAVAAVQTLLALRLAPWRGSPLQRGLALGPAP